MYVMSGKILENSCRLWRVPCRDMRWVPTDLSMESNTRLHLQGQAVWLLDPEDEGTAILQEVSKRQSN